MTGILVGGLVGVVNGLVITRLKVVPFIATLGMLGVARGVAKWMANQQTVNMPGTWLNELLVMFPNPAWLLVAPGVWITIFLRFCSDCFAQHGFWTARFCARLKRSRRPRVWHRHGSFEESGFMGLQDCSLDLRE